ncbi:unnamed protein product [Gemmataceae bacterium]|nr:unnamed protein product [Gemmataceae bacterium]VTT96537.1 unnamed protein product [Gemmataceae bacterium]
MPGRRSLAVRLVAHVGHASGRPPARNFDSQVDGHSRDLVSGGAGLGQAPSELTSGAGARALVVVPRFPARHRYLFPSEGGGTGCSLALTSNRARHFRRRRWADSHSSRPSLRPRPPHRLTLSYRSHAEAREAGARAAGSCGRCYEQTARRDLSRVPRLTGEFRPVGTVHASVLLEATAGPLEVFRPPLPANGTWSGWSRTAFASLCLLMLFPRSRCRVGLALAPHPACRPRIFTPNLQRHAGSIG